MCGLYASIGFVPDRSRLNLVSHRGPDDEGWREFVSPAGSVALGLRRLAVIDLSEDAQQPMEDCAGRYHLVFNGEIYNYRELREELRGLGWSFRTSSDTEVLLKAYMAWKQKSMDRFVGMFAFVIWDDKEKTIFAARDRFGIKPLYFVKYGTGVAFGSEIKQLLNLHGMPVRMNLVRMRDFLRSGISDHTEETLFDNVTQLRGGEYAIVSVGTGGKVDIRTDRWYRIPTNQEESLSDDDASARFGELLRDAVRLHMRSDVPVGSCLSGGLDSSSLVCLMTQLLEVSRPGLGVRTISACFDEKTVDERRFMESVIRHTGSRPTFVYPSARDLFEHAEKITWHQDEPFGSTSIFAQWCVFEEAKRGGITVMLDGQGADEPIAGYHSSFRYCIRELQNQHRWGELIRTVYACRAIHGISLTEQLSRVRLPLTVERLCRRVLKATIGPADRRWLNSESIRGLPSSGSVFDEAVERAQLESVTDLRTYCVAMTFAARLPTLLHYEDRNSMAHGIEGRVPFLDHRLVEFVLSLGGEHKIKRAETKRVMRRAMANVLPREVQERQDKLGFSTPEEGWFRGILKMEIRESVEQTLRQYPDLLNAGETRLLMDDYLTGRRAFDFTLWRIASVGIWGRVMGVSM